ncbi:MAG: hypothetical protein AAGF12_19530 [Myxococcota bacterium]
MTRLATCVVVFVGGCSLSNDIDVCEGEGPPAEVGVTMVPTGFQASGPGAVGEIPGRGAFVVFPSIESNGLQVQSFLRASVFQIDGQRRPPCPRIGILQSPPYAALEGVNTFVFASVSGPESASMSSLGLIVAVQAETDAAGVFVESKLVGTSFDGDGCPQTMINGGGGSLIDLDETSVENQVVGPPAVLRIANNRYVVGWVSGTVGSASFRSRLKARIVETNRSAQPTLGPIVEIERGLIAGMAMTRVEDRVAFAWEQVAFPDSFVALELRDLDLQPVEGLDRQVLEFRADGAEIEDTRIALGYDGNQMLAAWVRRVDGQATRISARFRGPDGEPFVSVDSLDGLPFQPSTGEAAEELNPTIASLPGGGLVLAWEEHGLTTGGAADRVQALVFDAVGQRRFLNQACGPGPVTLSMTSDLPVQEPSIAFLGEAGLVGAWSATDRPRNLSEVRVRTFPASELFPVR